MRWVSLLLLAACGDNIAQPIDPFEPSDGSRLILRHWRYEDATRQLDPTVFFDTELHLECRPQTWSDGLTYCTPTGVGAIAFEDAACAAPVAHALAGLEVPALFAKFYVLQDATRMSKLYRRGAARSAPREMWLFANNTCSGPFSTVGLGYFDAELVEPVRIHHDAPAGSGRVQLAMQWTDDGMRAPGQLHDTFVGAPCEITLGRDGAHTCLPKISLATPYFRDATCTHRVASTPGTSERPQIVALDDDGCTTYFHAGADEPNAPLFTMANGACIPITLPGSDLLFGLGEPFEVAPLERQMVGMKRLQPLVLVDADMHVPDARLFDTTFGVDCERVTINPARCIPLVGSTSIARYYGDEACQFLGPRTAQVPRRACDPPYRYARDIIPQGIDVIEIGEPFTAQLYTFVPPSSCLPVEPPPNSVLHVLGLRVPLQNFPSGRLE